MSKKLYNYVTNTFGISKELILEQVNSRVEDLINKNIDSLLRSNRIERMILDHLSDYIKNGKVDRYFFKRKFETVIEDQIRIVIEDYLKNNCEIKFNFNKNSISITKEN
jgi:hypothetical protein